jgi:hypothetical protein
MNAAVRWKRWLVLGGAAVVLAIGALTWWTDGRPWAPFVGERRWIIPSEAMAPTLKPGDGVQIDGETLDEPYLPAGTITRTASAELGLVPPGSVVLLGDNRDNSLDSRYFGPVPLDDVRSLVHR